MALTRLYLKPGETVVADIEVVLVIDIHAGRFDFISRPLRMGTVEIKEGVALVPGIRIDMHKIVARHRVQEAPTLLPMDW